VTNPDHIPVTILGTGAVGSALLDFFRKESFPVRSHWNSRFGSVYSQEKKKMIRLDRPLPETEHEIGDLVFITAPDDQISVVSEKLARLSVPWEGKKIIHCSGNLTSDELVSLANKGSNTVSMHPIQTFKKGDGAERFKNITISLEGDEKLALYLMPLIKKMGGEPVRLNRDQKRMLHIGAVFASNYFVALLHAAETFLENEGIENGLKMMRPLISQTLVNIMEKGTADALTGPISRGDTGSVKTHLTALEKYEDTKRLYKLLGSEAVRITRKKGELSDDVLNETEKLFGEIGP
jgi:predicted short-subunit dehydrogenase-like oxidoreductase (DUF2520 family)